jgi:uncharacterized membrane protein YgcG
MFGSVLHLGMSSVSALALLTDPFFMTMWNNYNNAITITTITTISYTILSVVLIGGVYGVFARGGDLRELIVLMVKVAACGLLISQWNTFFVTDITTNGVFQIASSINATDVFSSLGTSLWNELQQNVTTWGGILETFMSDGFLEILEMLFTLLAMICYAVSYGIVCILFTLWGLILYAMGPMLVATIPSGFFSSLGKTYVKSLIEWLSWPVLFAIISELMSQLNVASSNGQAGTLWNDSPLGSIGSETLLAMTTIVFSLMLLALPWMAHKILNGDFAGSMGASASQMINAAKGIGTAVATAGAGAALGAATGGAGMLGAGAGGGSGAAGGTGGGGSATAGGASSGGPGIADTVSPPPATPGGGSGGHGMSDAAFGAILGAAQGPRGVMAQAARAHFWRSGSKQGPPPPTEDESYQMSFGDTPSSYFD